MKVLSKILGAVLLLGCLAYISFIFGKYVLSSTLLKSIPKSERIIRTDNPTSPRASVSDSSSDGQDFTPQVQMHVLPDAQSARDSTANSDDSSSDSSDSNSTINKPKKFDDGEVSSPRRKRTQPSKTSKESHDAKRAIPETNNAARTPKKKSSTSSPTPVRRLNQEVKKEDSSPVPKPEKSPSTSYSGSGDAASISPVPKPE